MHLAFHMVTTESRECDARPEMTWAAQMPAGEIWQVKGAGVR